MAALEIMIVLSLLVYPFIIVMSFIGAKPKRRHGSFNPVDGIAAPRVPQHKWEEYRKYIISRRWSTFKRGIYKSRGAMCERCGATNTELHVHHLTYKNLFNEQPSDVVILCKDCHNRVHGREF